MIVRHDLFEIERIEQLLLIPDAPSHHRTTPPMFASKRRNHCSATASIDFCNKIDPERTYWLLNPNPSRCQENASAAISDRVNSYCLVKSCWSGPRCST